MAILRALKYIGTAHLDRVITETDSLLIKNIVEKTWKVPWKVVTTSEEIWKQMQGRTMITSHILRKQINWQT